MEQYFQIYVSIVWQSINLLAVCYKFAIVCFCLQAHWKAGKVIRGGISVGFPQVNH